MSYGDGQDDARVLARALRGPRSRAEEDGRASLSLALGLAALLHLGFLAAAFSAPEHPKKRQETRERTIETLRVESVRREIPEPRPLPPPIVVPPDVPEEPVESLAESLPAALPEPPALLVAPEEPVTVARLEEPPAPAEPSVTPRPPVREVAAAPPKAPHAARKRSRTKRSGRVAISEATLIAELGSIGGSDALESVATLDSVELDRLLGESLDSAVVSGISGVGEGGYLEGGIGIAGGPGEGKALTARAGHAEGASVLGVAGEQRLLAIYARKVSSAFQRRLTYPPAAARRRIEGVVMVELVIEADGEVVGCRMTRSSGHDVLDEAALEAVRKVGDVPKPPDALRWTRRALLVPLSYELR